MADSSGNQNSEGRPRRGSVGNAVFSSLFQRNNSTATGVTPVFPPATINMNDAQRRRLSISTLGLSGTSPTNTTPFSLRRGSMSTNSDSIDENAIDEDDSPASAAKTAPTTPFTRRVSFGAPVMRGMRPNGNGSPGSNGNSPSAPPNTPATMRRRSSMQPAAATGPVSAGSIFPLARRRAGSVAAPQAQASNTSIARAPSDMLPSRPDQGFNWSEQLRSRAESSISGARPTFSLGSGLSSSPPRNGNNQHDIPKPVAEMPPPPVQAPAPKPRLEFKKPDAFQERILKGDFYMD